MHFKFLLSFLTLFSVININAQNTGAFKGAITTEDGEPIVGANVQIKKLSLWNNF